MARSSPTPTKRKKRKPDQQELLEWAAFFYDLYETDKEKRKQNELRTE